jgi:glucose/arabinose dehydrogenase
MIRLADGAAEPEIFATGLRNTVGFDWQPATGALHGVDNGRDWLGDEFPPDELNLIERGGFYGWPWFHGDNVPDPDLAPPAGIPAPVAPVHAFGAHVAPLSIRFLRHQAGPAMDGAALVAQHGSWNRSEKTGYSIVSLHWGDDGAISRRDFVTGFETDGGVVGRPVDVVEADDGTIFVSDDFAGAIYRLVRSPG